MGRALAAGLALALTIVAAPLEASRPAHTHVAQTAGLYNEEHVFAEIGSLHRTSSLAGDAPTVLVAFVTTACLVPDAVHPCAPVASLADPRAPPRS